MCWKLSIDMSEHQCTIMSAEQGFIRSRVNGCVGEGCPMSRMTYAILRSAVGARRDGVPAMSGTTLLQLLAMTTTSASVSVKYHGTE